MKYFYVLLASIISISSFGASIYSDSVVLVPRISEEHLLTGETIPGNLAYDKSEFGVSLYVGDEPVVDPNTLHGTSDTYLSYEDYTLELDNMTKDATKEFFYVYGLAQVGHLTVRSSNFPIDIEYETFYDSDKIEPALAGYITVVKLDPYTIRFDISSNEVPQLGVGNLKVRISEEEYLNDLTQNRFKCKDTIGTEYLHKWRDWAKHLYDGNRGENWSNYKASSEINLNGHSIIHDADRTFMSTSYVNYDTNTLSTTRSMVMTSGGRDALMIKTIYPDSPEVDPSVVTNLDLHFTSINVNREFVILEVAARQDSEILIQGCTSLEIKPIEWAYIPIIENMGTTFDGEYYIKKFKVFNDSSKAYFYRAEIKFSTVETKAIVCTEIDFEDKVIFKRNGHTYRLEFPEEGGQVTVIRID